MIFLKTFLLQKIHFLTITLAAIWIGLLNFLAINKNEPLSRKFWGCDYKYFPHKMLVPFIPSTQDGTNLLTFFKMVHNLEATQFSKRHICPLPPEPFYRCSSYRCSWIIQKIPNIPYFFGLNIIGQTPDQYLHKINKVNE